MRKVGDYGEDDEELMEYAMHPTQYEDYKSGKAKEKFLEDLEKRRAAKAPKTVVAAPTANQSSSNGSYQPKVLHLTVNGEQYKVSVSYDDNNVAQAVPQPAQQGNQPAPLSSPSSNGTSNTGAFESITSPLEGKFFLTKEASETPVKVGDQINKGDTVAYIEAMKVINAITADKSGTVVEIVARHGEDIEEDDVIFKIQ